MMLFTKYLIKWKGIGRISWKFWYWFNLKISIELDTKKTDVILVQLMPLQRMMDLNQSGLIIHSITDYQPNGSQQTWHLSGNFSVFYIVNSVIFSDWNFHCFLGFYTTFLRNSMSESAEISRVGLSILQWQINYEVFVKFSEQFNKSEIFNDEFYFKIF